MSRYNVTIECHAVDCHEVVGVLTKQAVLTRVAPQVSCAQYCPAVSTLHTVSYLKYVLYQMQYSHETRLY